MPGFDPILYLTWKKDIFTRVPIPQMLRQKKSFPMNFSLLAVQKYECHRCNSTLFSTKHRFGNASNSYQFYERLKTFGNILNEE